MSDTPRTDAVALWSGDIGDEVVSVNLSRALERELAAAQAKLLTAVGQIQDLQIRIATAEAEIAALRSEAQPVAYSVPREALNPLQELSAEALIDRSKHAHYCNVHLRINGKDEIYEADWLKHMTVAHPQPVPEGMVLVPVEPTEEMVNAMRVYAIVTDRGTTTLDKDEAKDIYRAMLAAAPGAPASLSGWISVGERLPDVETPVLIAGKPYGNHGQMIALGHWDGREWLITDTQFGWVEFEEEATGDDDEAENVTHWQPLPAAPGAPK
jgi:hypothetical protein